MTTKKISLPDRVQKALDELLSKVEAKVGPALVSVLVHGSAARGGYDEATSDVDLVIVLEKDSVELLEELGEDLVLARTTARIEPMLIEQGEIARAADVFPLLFEDLAAEGIALRGKNPFTDLAIDDDHRRLRIEQELREARIRLRVAIADASAGLLRREGIVARKLRQLRSPLHALLRRVGKAKERDLKSVVRAAGEYLEVDTAPLLRFREAPGEAVPALVALLDAAIAHVDDVPEAKS